MNTRIFNPVRTCISLSSLFIFVFIGLYSDVSQGKWRVDFSRRQGPSKDVKTLGGAKSHSENSLNRNENVFNKIFSPPSPSQELVILNTRRGFVPETINARAGNRYVIHVVNVNKEEKNVSFILDAFSEHHATYFGQLQSFTIEPKKEGIFIFQCPETSASGRLVVHSSGQNKMRRPAAAGVGSR